MKVQVLFFVIALQTAKFSSAARILGAIPSPYYSHQAFYRPLWEELANRGHDVVLLTARPINKTIANLHQIDMSFILDRKAPGLYSYNFVEQIALFSEAMLDYIDLQLGHPIVQSFLRNESEHFDLVMVEFFGPPMFALKERFKCPMIMLSSLDFDNGYHELLGNPSHDLLYSFLKVIKQDMDFVDRLYAFLYKLEEMLFLKDYFIGFDKMVRKHFGADYPPLQEIIKELDMSFINTNVVLNRPRPITPATINIGGGMHMDRIGNPNKLPKDLKTFLDESRNGVIYFTMGSHINATDIPIAVRNKLIATFAGIKYDVLWKLEDVGLSNISKNVKMLEWVPQLDVLSHKNVKLFITQGGEHSLEEAIVSRKPMIVFPFLADQHTSAIRVEDLGLGLNLNVFTSTSEQIKAAISDVIENPTYKAQLEKYANIMNDMPMKPLETAVWWTEYVLRHKGSKHLRGKTLPVWSYYYLDVIAFIVIVSAILTLQMFIIAKKFYRHYCILKQKSKEKSS